MLFLTSELANEAEITILSSCTLCISVGRLWRLTVMSAKECFSDTVARGRWKKKMYTLMTIWIEDFLPPNSLGFKPCKLLVSIYLAFAQCFVTLCRGGSRQALPK